MAVNWLDLVGAGLGSGLTVKILDYLYKEYVRKSDKETTAKKVVDKNIEPILKSADELVGKIRSLAQSDFKDLIKKPIPKNNDFEPWIPYLNIVYLFSQFWARIQILRLEGLFINLNSDTRGEQLQNFIRALESTKSRIVDRAWQRGIGESLIDHSGNEIRILTFNEFVEKFLASEEEKRWYRPLIHFFTHSNHKKYKQKILNYGVILQALTDTLDEDKFITRKRPSWPNKLTNKSKRNLQYRIFKIYLPFVKNPSRYYKK